MTPTPTPALLPMQRAIARRNKHRRMEQAIADSIGLAGGIILSIVVTIAAGILTGAI